MQFMYTLHQIKAVGQLWVKTESTCQQVANACSRFSVFRANNRTTVNAAFCQTSKANSKTQNKNERCSDADENYCLLCLIQGILY